MIRFVPLLSLLLSSALCVACGAREIPVITIDVEVETLAPAACLPAAFDDDACGGRDIVFNPGCGNRDLDSDEPVSTLNLAPDEVNALVFLRYQGPDQLLVNGGDQGAQRVGSGVLLHELTTQVTFDVVAAHDNQLVLYSVGLDDSIAVGDVVDLERDDRELTIEYEVDGRRIQERHSVGAVADRSVRIDDGRFTNENLCGCSEARGTPFLLVVSGLLVFRRRQHSGQLRRAFVISRCAARVASTR